MNTGFISIRLRGEFAEEAKKLLEDVFHNKNFEPFRIRIGDTYKRWKMNTLEQVIFDGPETDYIGIFQEDFRFTSPAEIVEYYVRDAIRLGEEAIELLPGPYYGILPPLDASQIWENRKKYVVSLHLDRLNILKMGRIVHSLTNWPAIYKKELLIKALVSSRPLFKKFHPDFPFDWEKSIRATWLLPFRWCAPRFEILACIDYDSLWPGSSLQSRELSDDNVMREDDTLDLMARNTFSFVKEIKKRVFKQLQKTETSSYHSLLTLLKHKIKRLLIYINGIRYSLIALTIVPFRLDELKLLKIAKSLIK